MINEKSPALEIMGITMATVTVLVAAMIVLKHSFQKEAFADDSQPEIASVADVDQPPVDEMPLRSQRELTGECSSESKRAAADRIYRAMEKPCPPLDFPRNTDLRDILEPIFGRLKQNEGELISILEDAGALDADSIVLDDVKIGAFHVEGISIRSALDELLAQTDPQLDYMVRNEVLLISTRTTAESDENLTICVYDVRHLVAPLQAQTSHTAVCDNRETRCCLPAASLPNGSWNPLRHLPVGLTLMGKAGV